MKRRTLLRYGAVATGVGFGGCLGSAGGGSSPTTDDADGSDATTDDRTTDDGRDRFSGVRSDSDEPFRTISVGSRDDVAFPDDNQPREVRVWNAADERREIRVRVSRDAKIVVNRTVEFPADGYLVVALNEPADYRVGVGPADGVDLTTVEISRSSFDCNLAGTDVGVMADGRVETMSTSTAMGCPGPAVADTEFSVGRATCGQEHSASVAFAGESVRVDGAVRTPTPQYDLALAAATYDEEADELTVRVRATESDESGAGVQCIGEVPYEATVEFDHALPSEVVVVHESDGEAVTVTRADRGGD